MPLPRSTYRLQFHERFRLADAIKLVPYLRELGVSHIYASPLAAAEAHSIHGYNVSNPARLNPEIGTETEFEQFVQLLRANKMGIILDIVPNHMGIETRSNRWWWDVLKFGQASSYACYFDINWKPTDPDLQGKILLPVLGQSLDEALQKNELRIENRDSEVVICYYDHVFPLSPESLPTDLEIEKVNGNAAQLQQMLEKQFYRLADWREGDQRLNYRRFFAVSTLAALRVDDPKVFDDAHALTRQWLEKQWIDGLRVDHPDGLYDPESYLRRLFEMAVNQWIVVEKILLPPEMLPETWPVHGTTGYDFLNQLNGLFIDPHHEAAFTALYSEFTGESATFNEIAAEKKQLVLNTLFTTEINRLTGLFLQICLKRISGKEMNREKLRDLLVTFISSFSVYRTYIRPKEYFTSQSDVAFIKQAETAARSAAVEVDQQVFNLLLGLFQSSFYGEIEDEFISRFQQLTGPVMAKGVEDTAFYCYNRFASLNEVGGTPHEFGRDPTEFHEYCEYLRLHWPHTMLCSSTHDTKRSEDVRARLNVLSEIPEPWRQAVQRWSKMNDPYRHHHYPDRNTEYLLYQTLVGAWPISLDRFCAYMDKACCEAKESTDWNNRNVEFDHALKQFITSIFADQNFINDLEQFLALLIKPAQINSLAQCLIKLTAPGVPDIYQGNELWDFSLVDPDNRRLVDFVTREKLLAESKKLSADEIWARRDEGLPKLWLIQKVFSVRNQHGSYFDGDYVPLFGTGAKSAHLVAFLRGGHALTVIPRLTLKLGHEWGNTSLPLPTGHWQNIFTNEILSGSIAAEKLFESFPVAFLLRKEQD